MLTKEKRNKIIAGAIVLSMLASAAGCGSNETEEQEEENGSAHTSMVYPWWMFWHWPMFGGTTNIRQGAPAPGGAGNGTNTAGTADGAKVSGAEAGKTGAATSKVASPTTGKTGISSGAARSSAVS